MLIQFQHVSHNVAAFPNHEIQFVIGRVQICRLLILPVFKLFKAFKRCFTTQFPAGIGNGQARTLDLFMLIFAFIHIQADRVHFALLFEEIDFLLQQAELGADERHAEHDAQQPDEVDLALRRLAQDQAAARCSLGEPRVMLQPGAAKS